MSVRFSEYHARYSPLMTESLTVTFFACQKASFVLSSEFVIVRFESYWKEYLPFSVKLSRTMFDDLIRKYSDSAVVLFILRSVTDQPNSGEIMSELFISTLLHSLNALMPWRSVLLILILSEYQSAARHLSVISDESMLSPWTCQNGYLKLK